MSYFDMFCRNPCNPILYMYNNYSNVLEMALPSQFFLGVLVHQDLNQMKGGMQMTKKKLERVVILIIVLLLWNSYPEYIKRAVQIMIEIIMWLYHILKSIIAGQRYLRILGNANFLHVHLFIIYHLFIYLCKQFYLYFLITN